VTECPEKAASLQWHAHGECAVKTHPAIGSRAVAVWREKLREGMLKRASGIPNVLLFPQRRPKLG